MHRPGCYEPNRIDTGSERYALSRPIAQAAISTTFFEKACVHLDQAEFRLNDLRLGEPSDLPFNALGITSTVRNYTIPNTVLDTDTCLLFQDGLVIPETSYFATTDADMTKNRIELVRLDGGEDIIVGYNTAHAGYQHWLTQCVPAIDWSLRQERTRPVRLVLPALASWQEDFLAILGHSRVPRVTLKPNSFYHLPHAEYSEFLSGRTSFGVCLSAYETMQRILDRVPEAHLPYQILFVPCSNPYYGIIRNEGEVIDLLRRRGAYIVDQRLGTTERINLFRNAEVVIGPFGQGLSDILFCKPGTLLWEWMPEHHQNASINCLAQAAGIDYWGSIFASDPGSDMPRSWIVDIDSVTRRLVEVSHRLALRVAGADRTSSRIPNHRATRKPIDELMLAFESLGDNCEFGLVQRHAGAEPLGLLRFAGMSLDKLIAALHSKFDRVGSIDAVTVYPAGEPGRREFMVHETSLGTRYHTFILEGTIEPEELRQREAKRLGFLRRKMLDDLATAEKIWVWRELGMTDPARLQALLTLLRGLGPNILLWVVAADGDHPPGTIERLERDFIKGYVERLAPYENATDISLKSWFQLCENVYNLCHPDQGQPEGIRSAEAFAAPSPHQLSAMEFLSANQATVQPTPTPQIVKKKGWLSWLGLRSAHKS
jgi:Glycosyltransferase 61